MDLDGLVASIDLISPSAQVFVLSAVHQGWQESSRLEGRQRPLL